MATSAKKSRGPEVWVVTGASRGLGLEWVRQATSRGHAVFAGCRTPASATDLQALATANPSLVTVLPLDVADETSVATFSDAVSGAEGAAGGVDVLVNNAGVATIPESVTTTTADNMRHHFGVNVLGPMLLTQRMLPLLKQKSGARAIMISTGLSSNEAMLSGGAMECCSYSVSKAAANMLWTQFATTAAEGVSFVTLHPGWVATDMGLSVGPAPVQPADSVAGMMRIVEEAKDGGLHGAFMAYDRRRVRY